MARYFRSPRGRGALVVAAAWILAASSLASAQTPSRPTRRLPARPAASAVPIVLAAQTDPVVFNNTAGSGAHYDITGGTIVFDEGRIPSRSAPESGSQDSYSISEFEIGYATRALGTASGGPGARVRIAFYPSGQLMAQTATLPTPVATFDLTGLPASTLAGSLSTHVVTVTPSAPICFRADGDGRFDPGASNQFIWAFAMPDESFGDAGPLIAGDPANCPSGDGTYFQAVGACGTGLGAVDGFGSLRSNGVYSYQDFGGYPQAAFGSFHLLVRAPLSGDCVGCGIADPFLEDNDTCTSAAPVALGSTTGLIAEAGDDDFYRFAVPANAEITATVLFDVSQGDLDLELFDGSCGTLLASSAEVGSDEVLGYFDCGGPAREFVLRVVAAATSCVDYRLILEAEPIVDDSFEDNDTCGQSQLAGVATFTTPGLVVTECDPDFYILRLISQREVQVETLFAHADSDVDVRIWDATCSTLLATSASTTDNELARYFNNTQAMSVVVEVSCSGGRGFAVYDFTVCYSLGDVISFQQCAGVPNSTGLPGTMCARGSDDAGDNMVLFYAVDLPSQAFGYFVTSLSTGVVTNAGGGQGTLCLGVAGIGRYANDVLLTNSNNAAFYQPDLTLTPVSGAPDAQVVGGETRYWQFWYRDTNGAGGATSNFTGSVGVTFR